MAPSTLRRVRRDQPWVLVRVQGGLGNQLFELAHGLAVSEDRDATLLVETGFLPDKFGRSYRLGAVIDGLRHVRARIERGPEPSLCTVRFRGLLPHASSAVSRYWQEDLDAPALSPHDNVVLHGLWQGAATAVRTLPTIRRRLILPTPVDDELLRISDLDVAVHLRLGDYVSNPQVMKVMRSLPLDYYREAVAHLRSQLGEPRFTVFSDDPSGAARLAEAIGSHARSAPRSEDELRDFASMRSFRHHIIANSTFSWWAALLKPTPGVTIMPRKWFLGDEDRSSALHPSGWITIDH